MLQSFQKWWGRSPGWLGLSVGEHGMTLVEMSSGVGSDRPICRWGATAWMAPASDPWANVMYLATQVKALQHRQQIQAGRLAIGLPCHRVVLQTLHIDTHLPARDVRAHVAWAAGQALDLEWDAVSFDYRSESIVDPQSGPSQDGRTVTWVACPKSLVRAAHELSQAAGLKLHFLGVEPFPETLSLTSYSPPDLEDSIQFQVACEMAKQGAQA